MALQPLIFIPLVVFFLSIIDASEKMSACVYCTLFNFASVALIAGTKMYGAAAR